jgi:hypothetical protein
MRPHPQPWHASSMMLHETALAVARVAPSKFWGYSLALFKAQEQFYDIPTSTMTPAQTREKAAELGLSAGILTAEEVVAVKALLLLNSTPNGGCAVTDDLKACSECPSITVGTQSGPLPLCSLFPSNAFSLQSSILGRIPSMFLPLCCSTG